MALIVLASAWGSPGVTTTALGLTFNWPRPVLLVEADPTGASGVFAGYFRGAGAHRRPYRPGPGPAAGTLAEALAARVAASRPGRPHRTVNPGSWPASAPTSRRPACGPCGSS